MVNINIEKFGKNQFKISILHDGKLEYFNDSVDKEQLVTSILLEAVHRVLKRMK